MDHPVSDRTSEEDARREALRKSGAEFMEKAMTQVIITWRARERVCVRVSIVGDTTVSSSMSHMVTLHAPLRLFPI